MRVSSDPSGKTTVFDEKSNADVSVAANSNFNLVTILPESRIIRNSRKNTMVSPFSKMLGKRLQSLMRQAGVGADPNALYKKASKEVVIRFGLNSGLSLSSTTAKSFSQLNLPIR